MSGDSCEVNVRCPPQVCCECGLDETVFPLSVSLLDRFLSATLSLPVSPYCLTAACVLIASKLSESENVTTDTLCAAADYSFFPSNLRVSDCTGIVMFGLGSPLADVSTSASLPGVVSKLGFVVLLTSMHLK